MPNIHHTLIHQVYALISEGNTQDLSALLTPDAQLISTHLGQASSPKAMAETLVSGYQGLNPWFNLTNVHTRIDQDTAVQSSYLTGGLRTPVGLFGGHQIVRFKKNETWQIEEIRFSLDWVQLQDSPAEIPGWDLNTYPEVILSEVDAPWHQIPVSAPGREVEQDIIATYIRYAWGIDQQDISLMNSAFAADATADMVPFGKMETEREIVAKLKSLRNGQPWMQHSLGRAVVRGVDEVAGTARMDIYRDVPEWDPTPVAEKESFGARYQAELRRTPGNPEQWEFTSLIYHPRPTRVKHQ